MGGSGGSGTVTALPTMPGSGSGMPGSGSGMPGSGSGMPPYGSGSGMPGGGYGSECAPGFLKVCPEMDGACPMDSMPVCPAPMTMPFVRSLDRTVGQMGSSDECECVPMVLMQMVMTQQEVMGRSLDRSGGDTFEDEDLHLLFCLCRSQRQGEESNRSLRQEVQRGGQEDQGQDGQGFCCWGLCWRFWRIWNAWRIRDARRIRNARRRIRPFWMCLRPHAQRHGDWRLWDAPNATNGIWIRNWRLRIWCHSTSSHWWQWNRLRLHLWSRAEEHQDCRRSGDRSQRVAMAGWHGLEWQFICLLWSNSH